MNKLFTSFMMLLITMTLSSAHAVVLQKQIHYVSQYHKSTSHKQSNQKKSVKHHKRNIAQRKHVSIQAVKPVRKVVYNRVQGYHTISAMPEKSSFSSKPFLPGFFVHTIKDKLVKYVNKTVNSLHYTNYKLGGRKYDPDRGVYVTDCSIYVDNILQDVFPEGYTSLVKTTGSALPTSLNYYNFFSRLKDNNKYWRRVRKVEQLQAGDILVFRNKRYRPRRASGHVMIVMDRPVKSGSAYLVKVADSAPYRHSRDTRAVRHSGIGIGTLVLRVNRQTGYPMAYAWQIGSRWKNNVRFIMARPEKT